MEVTSKNLSEVVEIDLNLRKNRWKGSLKKIPLALFYISDLSLC